MLVDEARAEQVAESRDRRVAVFAFGNRFGLLIAWAIVLIVFGALLPQTFLTPLNVANILNSQAILLILTLAVMLPLITGEFDVSVSGVLGISVVLVGLLNVNLQWPILAAIAVAIGAGLVVGIVNAFFVVRMGIPSFVVTLGTWTLLQGAALGISAGTVSGVDPGLVAATRTPVFGIFLVFFYALALTVIVWYALNQTPLGRQLFFTGANQAAARLNGVPVDRLRAGALVASAVVAAIAGVLLVGVLGSASPTVSSGYALSPFAAAFLGSVAFLPGRFNAWGSFVAVYFLATGINGLQLLGLAGWIEQVFYGAALILAVTFSTLSARRSEGSPRAGRRARAAVPASAAASASASASASDGHPE
jgi:ribose transport system permease protein